MDVAFYRAEGSTPGAVDAAVPPLAQSFLKEGQRVLIHCPTLERRDRLNTLLWSYDDVSFLPHGVAEDGHGEQQPVFLVTGDENPNRASVLFLLDLGTPNWPDVSALGNFTHVIDLFRGADQQEQAARRRWRSLLDKKIEPTFFSQTSEGWSKKQ
jgi:DNA polymerase-3 subunit chi